MRDGDTPGTSGQPALSEVALGLLGRLSAAPAVTKTQPVAKPATPTTPVTAGATCTGTAHTVVAGDTLWTIAAHTVKSADTGRVTVAWHRLYKANQPPLGSNPSFLPIGAKLCVPSSI